MCKHGKIGCSRSLTVEIMSRELALDDIVTDFLLNTCRLCPRSKSKHAIHAAIQCGVIVTAPSNDRVDTERINIPLTTGSVAEFYIEPMLPYVCDVDVMYHALTR